MTHPEHPLAVVAAFHARLHEIPDEQWTDGPVPDVAMRLHAVRVVRAELADIAQDIEDTLVASMETDTTEVAGLGLIHRAESRSATWAYDGAGERMRDDVARAVAQKIAVDLLTGEVDVGKRNLVMEAMRLAYEVIPAFTTLKVQGRKSLNLSTDDYRRWDTTYKITIESERTEL